MKSGSPRASDDFEPQGSQTGSEQENDQDIENGFVKVHDARARKGEQVDSLSLANHEDVEN